MPTTAPPDEPPDDLHIAAVRCGNISAFEPLVARHLDSVRTFLALKAPAAHLIDELTHETFVFAYRHLDDFQIGTSLRKWLTAIAWNLLRAEVQRFSREQVNQSRFLEHQLFQAAAARLERGPGDDAERLAECIEKVNAEHREVINLTYRDGYTSEEVANRMRRSAIWVRTILFRVRRQLRACIEQRAEEPC